MSQELLIVGASARAAAQSARRAGLVPFTVDLFADKDLQALGCAARATDYPQSLVDQSRQFPAAPWMYTGALENHPAIIAAIARERELWGCGVDAVQAVRDPWRVAAALADSGCSFPELLTGDESPTEGDWVRKPFQSGGGTGVRRATPRDPLLRQRRDKPATHYSQRFVSGEPISATFVAANSQLTMIGMTRQLIGCSWAGAHGFQYVGSVGPCQLPPVQAQLARIGMCLAKRFPLRGLFGVDAILQDETVWAIEINPRYTASVEVLERGLKIHALALHARAFQSGHLPALSFQAEPPLYGKATLFALRNVTVKAAFSRWAVETNHGLDWPLVADIPAAGNVISAQRPVCTVFAEGGTASEVEAGLRQRAEQIFSLLEN